MRYLSNNKVINHNDHRGAPVFMTDRDARVVWTAMYRPYGEAYVDDDPDGDGTLVTSNLRYPGQYEDTIEDFPEGERLYYNVMRYYDPGLGRYISSEIASSGTSPEIAYGALLYSLALINFSYGISNNYTYAENNPFHLIDLLGSRPYPASGSYDYNDMVRAALARIASTPTGRELMDLLDKISGPPINPPEELAGDARCPQGGSYRGKYPIGGVCWDPRVCADINVEYHLFIPVVFFFIKIDLPFDIKVCTSPDCVLAHELGHAAGYEDPENIEIWENPICRELGYPWDRVR